MKATISIETRDIVINEVVDTMTALSVTDANGTTSAQIQDGVDNIFWATYGITTYAEISAALTSGKAVMMYYKNLIFLYGGVYAPNNTCHFTTFSNNTTIQCCEINTQTNVWTATHSYGIITDAKIQANSTRAPIDTTYYSGLKAKRMLFAG